MFPRGGCGLRKHCTCVLYVYSEVLLIEERVWSLQTIIISLALGDYKLFCINDFIGSQSKNRSLIVSESETEEEILYETNSKKGSNKQEKKSLIPKTNNNSALSIKVLRNDLSNTKNS